MRASNILCTQSKSEREANAKVAYVRVVRTVLLGGLLPARQKKCLQSNVDRWMKEKFSACAPKVDAFWVEAKLKHYAAAVWAIGRDLRRAAELHGQRPREGDVEWNSMCVHYVIRPCIGRVYRRC